VDEFDLITDALGAVRTIQGVYGTTHDAATRVDEVAQILRLRAKKLSDNSGAGSAPERNALALAVAEVIRAAYGTKS
jgi:hypothetical protein